MKVIRFVDETLEDINQELLNESQLAALPKYRQFLIGACGLMATSDPQEAIDYFDIGQKIKNSDLDLNLEDADYEKLKRAVEKNPCRWPAIFFAQMILKIRSAKDIKEDK